ncbi:hypothetical protein [Rheinheimera nanhaiensis]|uniref:Transmembrane protein n=1 Tax=Rheinheimera nanhaiensis E407-8 TaxID=562729 RepID=I1DZI2_9GAMM|nr:hypothetical protein [Rheinheimera nanhaiensis]GAB59460.1 hypothetical protein RNAN_2466 [Rheinheimera nanhaiensis E407-8]
MNKAFKLKLIIRRAPAQAALGWLKQAWAIFMQAPLVWLFIYLHMLGFLLLSMLLPPISSFIVALLMPFLTAGIYKTVVTLQQGKQISVTGLYQVFKEPQYRVVFIRLALAELVASLPLVFMYAAMTEQAEAGDFSMSLALMFAVWFTVSKMAFAYTIAVAYFLQQHSVLVVMQASLVACWRNITPLALYSLLSLGLIMLTMPTLFIGLIVVLPLLHIAFFLSFNEFFALQVKSTDDGVLEV